MVTWMITVECLVLVKQVAFCYQTAVDIAILKIDGCLALVLDVWDFVAAEFTKCAVEDEQLAMTKDNATALECGMQLWLSIEDPRHLYNLSAR